MIRIVIAEDQALLLDTIGSLLNLEEDMKVVGQASNGEEALNLVNRYQPDVCILDLEMPLKNGLEAAEELKSFGCKVIILTTFAKTGYFERALQADVRGYLLKDSSSEELACSIRSIMKGERVYAPELIDDELCLEEQDMDKLKKEDNGLSANKQMKKVRTVRNYFSTIMEKIKLPTG